MQIKKNIISDVKTQRLQDKNLIKPQFLSDTKIDVLYVFSTHCQYLYWLIHFSQEGLSEPVPSSPEKSEQVLEDKEEFSMQDFQAENTTSDF